MKNLYKKLLSVLVLLMSLQTQAQVITSVSPNSANVSETIVVTISGAGFSFGQGTGTIQVSLADSITSFNNIIYAEQVQVINSNTITATFTFDFNSVIGIYDLYVIDSQGNYSLEQSAFQINAPTTPFTLTSITPNTAQAGQVINVSISGQGASFGQGTSTTEALLLNGTNTISADSVTVINTNNISAQFTLNNTTSVPGNYTLYVYNSIDGAVLLPTAFNITPNPNAPSLTSITPSNAIAGNTISVSISGQNTHFGQGTATTQVWFNQGSSTLYSSSVNVISTNTLTANIIIPSGVSVGQYNTNVSNNVDGDLSLANSFTVNANPNGPIITSVTPNTGGLGESIPVTISGQNTNFMQGTGTVMFTQGTSTLSAYITGATSDTELNAVVYVPYDASLGSYQLTTNFTTDGAIVLNNAFNVTQASCNISVYVNSQVCSNTYADVYISGGTPPYNLIINGQSYISYSDYFMFMPPSTGTYQITNITDYYGCTSSIQNTSVAFSSFTGSLTGNIITCLGFPITITDSIVSQSPITYISYDYGDGTYGSSATHTYLYSGTFTPNATVYNADGCSLYLQGASITVEELPTLNISNIIPSSCSLNNGSFTITSSGISYSITNLQTGYTWSNPNNLAPGDYLVAAVNASGCSNTTTVTIAGTTNNTNIAGTITNTALLAAGNAQIELLALNDVVGAMNTVATTTTDATGVYSFSFLNEGSYLMQVTPDTSVNPGSLATYYNNQALWNFADTIQVTCAAGSQTIDIVLLNIDTANGNATVSGNVSSSSFNRSVIGDAIVGANVLLHNNISNSFSNIIETDVNGDYEFTGIAPGTYSVLVDLGGLDMLNAYSFTIQANQTITNRNFYVDTVLQTIDTLAPNITTVKSLNDVNAKAFIYPNPFSDNAKLVYNISNTTMVTIELFDVLGNKVSVLENSYKEKGTYTSTVLAPSNGIYFVKIITNNKQQILKVISKD